MMSVAEEKKTNFKTIRKFSCKLKQASFGNLSNVEDRKLAVETSFNQDGKVIREVRFNVDDEKEEIHDYTYNSNHKLMMHHWQMPLDGVEEAEKMERDEKDRLIREVKLYSGEEGESVCYIYDEKDRVLVAEYKDEEGSLTLREDYEYNDWDTLLARKITDHLEGHNRVLRFVYNDKKNLSEHDEFDAAGALISKTVYEQDEKGNDVSIVQYNAKNLVKQRVISTFNEEGKLIKRISSGNYTRIVQFEYDESGNIIDEITTDDNGIIISRNSFEYDEKSHLVYETFYEMDLTHNGRDTNMAARYEYDFY